MSSKSQQTVERSAVDYVFCSNDDIVEGIGAEWNPLPEYLKLDVTFTDGMNSGTNLNPETTNLPAAKAAAQTGLINDNGDEFTTTNSEYAFTGRADVKIVGDWKQEADVESWSTDPDLQAFVGAAFHYEENNRNDVAGTAAGTGVSYGSFAEWTADALVKCHGFGAMGSFFGAHFNDATPTASGVTSLQYWGATAQAGYTIKDKVEPFIRYEWLFPDGNLHTNQVNIVTVGANYFIKKHVAKFTLDSMWVLDNLNATNTGNQSLSGTGLVNDVATRKNEVVIRAQFQLLF
jgi:hypothetical protein